tara:strand:+ start:555 stop:740 length:186 start_codon:yes stop_codon:yes gene_type:complete
MDTAEEALRRIEIHEAECKLLRQNIEKRLDQEVERFNKLEKIILAMYPFIIACLGAVEYFS